ncbi:MAG: glycerol-3-phosphate 1-O-acyltransferase PlsB [Gammaproteobacteria bacterium]|nr:glycerol-3-phosphate 1-O-acyltransferase PlsB [Gammaproteobacteria bacterium]
MSFVSQLLQPLYWLAGKIFATWARPAVQPDNPASLLPDPAVPVCYVLETGGLADTLALERLCRLHGLPSPTGSIEFGGVTESSRVVVLRRMQGFLFRRPRLRGSMRLKRIIEAAADSGDTKLLLVPVAIYWGRSPDKEGSWLKLLFSEYWEVAGRTRKFFVTLFQGRNTLLRYSEPLPLSTFASELGDTELAYRKVSRILRVHFRKRRNATVGPDLSHRRTLINSVLRNPSVRAAIAQDAGEHVTLVARKEREAREYALEIAANLSYSTVHLVERFLGWLWHRIYDGIELNHADRLHEVAATKEIVYVPCHRSHFDYLLLSYIVYHQGLSVPHVAAGINLNIPIVGAILRRGGAFFLRRSFKGNKLYAAVFNAYLHEILVRGHAIEYFVEGGRSRTGRLLAPKAGMLAMTVSSYLHDPGKPIVFVPVYFGYEKLIEGDSFIRELSGATKRKESLIGLIRSVSALRERFGKVYVNVGDPIDIEAVLGEVRPDWRDAPTGNGERPPWISGIIDELGRRIMGGINSAAAVTPISLLALVLLSTPRQKIGVKELQRQLALYLDLLKRFRYSDTVTWPDWTPEAIVAHGGDLGVIRLIEHPLGAIVTMSEHEAVLMTYFRNNILHLFAVPASVACCFIQGRQLEHAELVRLVDMIYPFMKEELCLKWEGKDVDDVTTSAIEALIDLGLLTRGHDKKMLVRPPAGSAKAYQLLMLGQSMVPMLQRFYLAIALLAKNGSGALTRAELEQLCQKSAERLSMIYGLHSPDFFDRSLFHDFISALRALDVLRRNEEGKLEFDESITRIGEDARLVLGEEIRHSILSLTVSAAEESISD